MLTELEAHGADLAAHHAIDLDEAAATATAGIAADVTFSAAGTGGMPGR